MPTGEMQKEPEACLAARLELFPWSREWFHKRNYCRKFCHSSACEAYFLPDLNAEWKKRFISFRS
jgi:hypothetical protein